MCSYFRVFFRSLFYIFGFMNPCAGIATLAYVWSLQEVSQTSILLSREYVRVGGLACCAFCQEFYLPAVHSTSFSSQSSSNNCIKYLPFFSPPYQTFLYELLSGPNASESCYKFPLHELSLLFPSCMEKYASHFHHSDISRFQIKTHLFVMRIISII